MQRPLPCRPVGRGILQLRLCCSRRSLDCRHDPVRNDDAGLGGSSEKERPLLVRAVPRVVLHHGAIVRCHRSVVPRWNVPPPHCSAVGRSRSAVDRCRGWNDQPVVPRLNCFRHGPAFFSARPAASFWSCCFDGLVRKTLCWRGLCCSCCFAETGLLLRPLVETCAGEQGVVHLRPSGP